MVSNTSGSLMSHAQGRYWLCTLSSDKSVFCTNSFNDTICYAKGQLERGDGGYLHWQFIISLTKRLRRSALIAILPPTTHVELSRSDAADKYVHKDDTSMGYRFEYGTRPIKRNSSKDWDAIWDSAKKGKLEDIPSDIKVRCYSQLSKIQKDFMKPESIERVVYVFWGRTGTGKSRRAWEEASLDAYPKCPNTKFWDGYRDQENVVIDEFRGKIDISHMLRWLDRYPVCIENKGSGCVLRAKKIWITSNLDPHHWYPTVDAATIDALIRRMNVIYFE